MMGMFALFMPLNGSALFPFLVYMVPNALFPLMTYFFWIRLSLYRPFVSLYLTGKIVAVVASIGWFALSFHGILALAGERTALIIPGMTLLLTLGDLFTILGSSLLKVKLGSLEQKAEDGGA
jgi:hypothetical protein